MPLSIATNISAYETRKSFDAAQTNLERSIQRLSTGKRINQAKDDAAGGAIVIVMGASSKGLSQGSRNANDGISLSQTAESGLTQIADTLVRLKELSIQISSGTFGTDDQINANTEYQALLSQIDNIAISSSFNGINLLDSTSTVSIQVGTTNTTNNRIDINLIDATTATLGVTGSDILSTDNARTAMDVIDTAIKTIATGLSKLGANSSVLELAVVSNIDTIGNLDAARSRIRDTDFADESGNLAKFNILQQAAAAMLSQANQQPNIVLKLLQ